MHVVLIRPPTLLRIVSFTVRPSPPLGVALIAGSLRAAGHQVTVIDAIAENPGQFIPFKGDIYLQGLSYAEIIDRVTLDTEMIGISAMFTNNWLSDRVLIDMLGEHFPKAKIVAGGEHITGLPEICMQHTKHLDVCVLGEGEETVVELAEVVGNKCDLSSVKGILFRTENNECRMTPRRARIKSLEEIPYPAWDLFPLQNYKENKLTQGVTSGEMSLPIIATRGCPYSCTFCSSPNMWGTRYYMREPDNVLAEMKYMIQTFGVKYFEFYDLTAIIKKSWIIEFSKKIIDEKLEIIWQIPAGTRSEAIDGEVAKYLYQSGCRNITYAPESGSPTMLKKIKKKVSLDSLLRSMQYSVEQGMNVKLNIIIGFPDERLIDIFRTIWFLIKSSYQGAYDMFPNNFIPYTGCELFEKLAKQGKINPATDDYYLQIINADSLFNAYSYNPHLPKLLLVSLRWVYLITFYGTNWLFRPKRFYKLVRNIVTRNFESRGEMSLHSLITRPFKRVNIKNRQRIKELATTTS